MPALLSAVLCLTADIFLYPDSDRALGNAKLISSLVQFLNKCEQQGCDVRRLAAGCGRLLDISKSSIIGEQCNLTDAVRVSHALDSVS